jgi:hypothetical protein
MKFKLPAAVVAFLNGWIFSLLIAILIATSIKSSLADRFNETHNH